ncbi:amidohydrolase family protein [Paludisphaera mucosa]|uniref:Amidohydrolase family protein n=1 Tax=Paludisphaera mucosa TaxID=3030827 RepID=A0ABT6FI59_9BACT|nr:amidohydrolase family protein [Paludisphaera mucosa]MDG3007268.1 amidohydrolase family protein [Paludisphaera mucosa]
MPTRRDLLRLAPAPFLLGAARAAEAAAFERIDSHFHIHRDAPAVFASLKASGWSGLDLVVCPVAGDEPFDLEARLDATLKGARASGGRVAWASTIDARGFESPDFAERATARLRKTFADGAIGVKIWKNIGMSIRGKSGAYLLPDDPSLTPIYETIEKAGKTLVAHLAEPDGAWLPLDDKNPEFPYYSKNPQWHMQGKGTPPKEAILAARDRVLARFSKLRVVGCHLGSDEDHLVSLARRLDEFPNFAVDTAARTRYFARGDRDRAVAFLTKYQDRILYATDYGLRDADPEAGAKALLARHDQDAAFYSTDAEMVYEGRPTRGLALPDAVVRKLFRENARRWLPGIGV